MLECGLSAKFARALLKTVKLQLIKNANYVYSEPQGIWLALMSQVRTEEASVKVKSSLAVLDDPVPMSKYTGNHT